jgi:hypothetical protein
MTWTNVQISPEEQLLLIKAAAQQKVSVELLASQILSEGIQSKLSGVFLATSDSETKNPLAGLLPYAYEASPEESPFPSEDWAMEQERE